MLALILGGLFTDHMVLQRDRANLIWGADQPHQVVTLVVEGGGVSVEPVKTTTDENGTWRLYCPELPAGGPYRLRVTGSAERVIEDVLVGDVWLASGQSNMEWPLARTNDATQEIAMAKWPAIRVAKIPTTTAHQPQRDVTTEWVVCDPERASSFTAVGYFFAREVHRHTGVPIGIIDSTWGGTPVEAWTSMEALEPVMPGVKEKMARVLEAGPERDRLMAEYMKVLGAWERNAFPQDTGNKGETSGWAGATWDDHTWRTMTLPNAWQGQGFKANGAVWFRREVEVPDSWVGRDLELSLGAIDDFETSYFNGERVGATGPETLNAYQVQRRYVVPGRLVHAGRNVVAVRVFDRYGDGGLTGPAINMSLAVTGTARESVSLAGEWRWEVEREIPLVPGDVFRGQPAPPPGLSAQNDPAALFNGMIAPLVPYGLRGMIWYQGEANTSQYDRYQAWFTAMIRDWRTRWGQGTLPFYFVQLAGFESNGLWPRLREAQAQTLAEPETGMAVTIDIGEAGDIHPRNKLDVGKRLAVLALRRTYGLSDIIDTGPTFRSVAINGSIVRVHLNSAAGLRTRDGGKDAKGFELAGVDGVYHPARARIDGETVILSSPDVPAPASVRYAWADYADVNLVNAVGLPAVPFRTDGF